MDGSLYCPYRASHVNHHKNVIILSTGLCGFRVKNTMDQTKSGCDSVRCARSRVQRETKASTRPRDEGWILSIYPSGRQTLGANKKCTWGTGVRTILPKEQRQNWLPNTTFPPNHFNSPFSKEDRE